MALKVLLRAPLARRLAAPPCPGMPLARKARWRPILMRP